jgi:3-methyladenine DNA glycosylase/8-oxoguanine DNA glycosylase
MTLNQQVASSSLAGCTDEKMRSCQISRQKSKYLRALSLRKLSHKRLQVEKRMKIKTSSL